MPRKPVYAGGEDEPKDGNRTVVVTDPNTGFVTEYSMSIRLRKNLDEKVRPDLMKKDKDCFLVIDGGEGKGKSTLAFQIGKYVDTSLNLDRVVFSPDDFREAVYKAKKGQCVIYDEAFTGLSSRSSLSMINKVLVSLTMQMRQKNLFVIIVLPTFFLLDKYIALWRARALIHVFESHGKRGYFKLYNTKLKKMLYLTGYKTYSYNGKNVRTNFRGRFYGKFALGDESIEDLYREKKSKALETSEKTSMSTSQIKYRNQRDLVIFLLKKHLKCKLEDVSRVLKEYNFDLTAQNIGLICAKFNEPTVYEKKSAPGQELVIKTKKKPLPL